MGIFDSNFNIEKWKYRVNLIEIRIKDKIAFTIPNERLTAIDIIEKFEDWLFPVFRVKMVLSSTQYLKITKNKNNVKFHIRLYKYYNYFEKVGEPSLNSVAIDDMFSLILDDEQEDLTSGMKEEEMRLDYTTLKRDDSNDMVMVDNDVEFFLYKRSIAVNLKNQINKIFNDVTVTDVISYLMYYIKAKNVLMSPATNNDRYSTIVIPNLTVLEALRFLDTYYGIYDVGSMIYFGFDYAYIIRYEGKCSAYTKGEKTKISIVIPKQISSHIASTGVLETKTGDKKRYIVADYQTIGSRNDNISGELFEGNKITVVNNFTGSSSNFESTENTLGSSHTKQQLNKTLNDWIGKTYSKQKKAEENVVNVRLGDYDMTLLRPNKSFNILFEDTALTKKYDGEYILSSVEHHFAKEGESLVLNSVCQFKRTK